MKSRFYEFLKSWCKFLRTWNEFVFIPLFLIAFWWAVKILRYADPTAGVLDVGVLHIMFFGTLKFASASLVTWVLIRIQFPSVFTYLDKGINQEFKDLTKWQKILSSILLLSSYLFCLVWAMGNL